MKNVSHYIVLYVKRGKLVVRKRRIDSSVDQFLNTSIDQLIIRKARWEVGEWVPALVPTRPVPIADSIFIKKTKHRRCRESAWPKVLVDWR